MAEKLFDDNATVTVSNAAINIKHDGPRARVTEPRPLTSAESTSCASWNRSGCIFYRQQQGNCIARTQEGLDTVRKTVGEARITLNELLERSGQHIVPLRLRDMWLRNRTLEKLIARGQLPIRYDRNRTISVYCPTRTFVGRVKVSDDTA